MVYGLNKRCGTAVDALPLGAVDAGVALKQKQTSSPAPTLCGNSRSMASATAEGRSLEPRLASRGRPVSARAVRVAFGYWSTSPACGPGPMSQTESTLMRTTYFIGGRCSSSLTARSFSLT